MSKAFWSKLGIAFTKGKSSVYGDEPARLLRMNACDAAGLGRKIEVEGKKYDPPAQCFDRYHVVSTEDVTSEVRVRPPEW